MKEYIMEDFQQLDLTLDEAKQLEKMGLIVKSDHYEHWEITALMWDELELSTNQAFLLIESLLQYLRGELVDI